MNYKPLVLQSIKEVRPFFPMVSARTCDFTVGGMFMWRDYFAMEYTVRDGVFYSRLRSRSGEIFYNLPVSENIDGALEKLLASEGRPLSFCTIPERYLPCFSEYDGASFTEQENFADYLYSAEELSSLAGKRFSGQRNLISQFRRGTDEWSFEIIGEGNIDRIREYFRTSYLPAAEDGDFEREENAKVLEVLDNFGTYGLEGGFLTADGRIVGFSLNEIVGDTMYTHIEKADRQCKGAYQMLANCNARTFARGRVLYINREEDMGDIGLRTSKQSYHPVELLKKYIVEVR